MGALERHLRDGGFAVLTFNSHDPSMHGPYEAWSYQGPLDFDEAAPRTFGVGADAADALEALDVQLVTDEDSTMEPDQGTSPSSGPQVSVVIAVSGGVAEVVAKPKGVAVRICDYDVDGSSETDSDVSTDSLGRPCCVSEWSADAQVDETGVKG